MLLFLKYFDEEFHWENNASLSWPLPVPVHYFIWSTNKAYREIYCNKDKAQALEVASLVHWCISNGVFAKWYFRNKIIEVYIMTHFSQSFLKINPEGNLFFCPIGKSLFFQCKNMKRNIWLLGEQHDHFFYLHLISKAPCDYIYTSFLLYIKGFLPTLKARMRTQTSHRYCVCLICRYNFYLLLHSWQWYVQCLYGCGNLSCL